MTKLSLGFDSTLSPHHHAACILFAFLQLPAVSEGLFPPPYTCVRPWPPRHDRRRLGVCPPCRDLRSRDDRRLGGCGPRRDLRSRDTRRLSAPAAPYTTSDSARARCAVTSTAATPASESMRTGCAATSVAATRRVPASPSPTPVVQRRGEVRSDRGGERTEEIRFQDARRREDKVSVLLRKDSIDRKKKKTETWAPLSLIKYPKRLVFWDIG